MKTIFVDTNIIIDFLADRKPFSDASTKLFDLGEKGKLNIMISALSYSNIYYIVKKFISHKELTALLKDLSAITTTLAVTNEIILQSLSGDFKDFEDSIQYHTALSIKGVDALVTRNVKDYKTSRLPVLTPDEVLSILESKGKPKN